MTNPSLPDLSTPWYTLEADKALEILQSDSQRGLTSQEVAERLQHYGPNELETAAGRSTLAILIDQFKNIMLLMLIGVAVVSAILDVRSALASGKFPFPKDAIAIMTIVILNGFLGFVQESSAEKALASLKKLSSPQVRVIRDGKVSELAAEQLVPGDIMLLEAGVQVAADGRLIEESNLQIREAALTGEALAVDKQVNVHLPEDTPLGDRINLVFRGTEVVQGRGTVLVTGTGMKTELGRIATMLESVEAEPTPLQRRMDQLGKVLVSGSLVLVALVVLGGVLRTGSWSVFEQLLAVSLSMAVAVVPEGLPAAITVTLALGTQRMVKRNALIRKLPAVETLGSVTVICSDKTGTLTQNKMVVQSLETIQHSLRVTGEGYAPQGEFLADNRPIDAYEQTELKSLLIACALCNDSILQQEGDQWKILGDPTEGALLPLAAKAGIEKDQWSSRFPRIAEFPFSSERKRMSVVCEIASEVPELPVMTGKPFVMFTKGSPELILERCQQVQISDRIEVLTDDQRTQILNCNNQMASQGLRVLGFAYRPLSSRPNEETDEATEQNLIWLGLIGMLDAPRPEVREAVARCRSAGIRPVMITGDHQLTAKAIAEDLGIADPGARVLTGRELDKLSEAELEAAVREVNIYARVAPEHKLKIVQALQHGHNIAAMTGDGVNDAPALKQADIGIAMGITGTDVSKEASDMVLLDDNFATIVAATEEGRVVYTNIRRFIKYILGSNIGEVLVIAASPILLPISGGVPLTPLQILWMNLVTDGLPALALAVEPAEPHVMNRPPHNPNESIFSRGLGAYMIRIGLIFTIISITLMLWAYNHTHDPANNDTLLNPERWKTMVFTTLCLAQLGHALAIRSNSQSFLEINPFSNRYLLPTLTLTAILQLLLIYVEPLRNFFGTHYLPPSELLVCFGFSALMFVWVELEKIVIRLYAKVSGKHLAFGD